MYFNLPILCHRGLFVLDHERSWNEMFWKDGLVLQILPWNRAVLHTKFSSWTGDGWEIQRPQSPHQYGLNFNMKMQSAHITPKTGLVSDAGCEKSRGHI